MLSLTIKALLFLSLCIFLISFPRKIAALQVPTTVYEDLKKSALVVVGRITHKKSDTDLVYYALDVDIAIYGNLKSATVTIVVVGGAVKTNQGLTMVVSTGIVQYEVGEEYIIVLQIASASYLGRFKPKGEVNYVTIRKINTKGLEGSAEFVPELKKLAKTLEMPEGKESESIFLALLTSKNDLIVESAVKELGNMKSRRALPNLTRLTRAGDEKVRFQVIDALRQIGGDKAISVITSALEDGSPRIRRRAASSLGWMGARGSEEILLRVFSAHSEDEGVRINAALALGNMGSKKAIPMFVDALKDENISKPLRRSIESTLRKLQ